MSTSTVTVKENHWVVGDMEHNVVHTAATKRGCQEWIAEQHGLCSRPAGHKLADGVWQVSAVDCTYWLMADAQTARDNAYPVPLADESDVFDLDDGQCALYADLPTGPTLAWKRGGHVKQQPVPPNRVSDVDVWAEHTARKLRSLGIIVYLGRREMRRP